MWTGCRIKSGMTGLLYSVACLTIYPFDLNLSSHSGRDKGGATLLEQGYGALGCRNQPHQRVITLIFSIFAMNGLHISASFFLKP
jgi:hypothetical protein